MRKFVLIGLVGAFLFPAAIADARPLPAKVQARVDDAALTVGLRASIEPADTTSVKVGVPFKCPRPQLGAYRCRLTLHYRTLDGTDHPWETCRAAIRTTRQTYRFRPFPSTCSDDWLL